jgi:mono/diheme cytochrome c family protein
MSGVFTTDQGARGQRSFQTYCAACHNAAEMRGTAWQRAWANRTLGDFHQFLSTQMPLDSPGSLSAAQYTDIIAYVLRENGYPAGTAELAPQPAMLGQIKVVPTP